MTHAEASELLGKRDSKKLANNTYLVRRGGDFAIMLHTTDVVTIHADDTWTLDTGGWPTKTTRDRIETYSPARLDGSMQSGWTGNYGKNGRGEPVNGIRPWTLWNFAKRSGDWSARGFAEYHDGVRIGADGLPVKVTA